MKLPQKQISVVMCVYNESENEIKESINSVLSQTYQNFELLIVNDNPSSERIKTILRHFTSNQKIKIIVNESNIGAGRSRNKAIEYSNGDYIAILDSDDVALPTRFEKQLLFLETNKNYAAVASNRTTIDENSHIIKKDSGIIVNDNSLRILLKYNSLITHSTLMFRAENLKRINGYRDIPAEDYDLILRFMSENYMIHILPETLTLYRVRKNSLTNSNFAIPFIGSELVKKLYRTRLKESKDCYTNKLMQLKLEKYSCLFDSLNKSFFLLTKIKTSTNILSNTSKLIWLIFSNSLVRKHILNIIQFQILLKLTKYRSSK